MLDDLSMIAVVLIVLWLAAFVFYMYTSRRQQGLEEELAALEKMLGPEDIDGAERPGE